MVQIDRIDLEKRRVILMKSRSLFDPPCVSFCVCKDVCVISLYRDSLMAVGIVNSSIASLPSPPPWRSNQLAAP